jgi:hypothetical protein
VFVHNPPSMFIRSTLKAFSLGAGLFGLAAGCGSGGVDDRPPRWSFIAPAIIQPSCATASCHSDIAQKAGVDLSDKVVGYNALVPRHFVIPSNVAQSELVYLLRAQGARRMPPDFALPEEDILLIQQWITNGAKND